MESNNNIKCSSIEHKDKNARFFCYHCNKKFCNKCEISHKELFSNEHNIVEINNDFSKIFTGFCKETNHLNKLELYCKNHNQLCCSDCITKIEYNGKGQHKDCDICLIENIKKEKKEILSKNINILEESLKPVEESLLELNKIIENIKNKKEELKLKIIKYFTKIRNEINKKEDEFISIIEKQFDTLFFKEDIIKNYDKLPNEMKSLLDKGKK